MTALAVGGTVAVDEALERAMQTFRDYDVQCTRFSPASDLMRANASHDGWTEVGSACYAAVSEAEAAYNGTQGRFDPRVLDDLVRLGYDRSRRYGEMSYRDSVVLTPRKALHSWRPEFRESSREVRIGPVAIDLGGIGKGLAVRASAADLAKVTPDFLIEAGGDCFCAGRAADASHWRIAVENPAGGTDPIAVLAVSNLAVATSSTRVCQWEVAGRRVHHLIDPKTGMPGGVGLASVTVVARDPANAEVWSKVLFLAGADGIGGMAQNVGAAALWVTTEGRVTSTPAFDRYQIWRAE